MAPKVDPELTRQLKTADDTNVEAVIQLKPGNSQVVPTPEQTEQTTKQILERTKERCGHSPDRYNVFRNLGSFVVSAKPAFIQELISQPEVQAVVANQQPGSALIPPVKKRPVRAAKAPKRKRATSSGSKKKAARKSTARKPSSR
jgi:hypothetical protein